MKIPLLFLPCGWPKTCKKRRVGAKTDSCRKHFSAKRDPDSTAFVAFGPPPSNKTSNKTFPGSLVPWPRLPRFANFPFHFPFRGEKGSAPLKNGLEQFQRPSKQQLRRLLHFNGGPLGISGQNLKKEDPIVTHVDPPWIPLDPDQGPIQIHRDPTRIPLDPGQDPIETHADPTWIPPGSHRPR